MTTMFVPVALFPRCPFPPLPVAPLASQEWCKPRRELQRKRQGVAGSVWGRGMARSDQRHLRLS